MYLLQKDEEKLKRTLQYSEVTATNSNTLPTIAAATSLGQERFDEMIIKYIVDGIQPLNSIEDSSFQNLLFGKYY